MKQCTIMSHKINTRIKKIKNRVFLCNEFTLKLNLFLIIQSF